MRGQEVQNQRTRFPPSFYLQIFNPCGQRPSWGHQLGTHTPGSLEAAREKGGEKRVGGKGLVAWTFRDRSHCCPSAVSMPKEVSAAEASSI